MTEQKTWTCPDCHYTVPWDDVFVCPDCGRETCTSCAGERCLYCDCELGERSDV